MCQTLLSIGDDRRKETLAEGEGDVSNQTAHGEKTAISEMSRGRHSYPGEQHPAHSLRRCCWSYALLGR